MIYPIVAYGDPVLRKVASDLAPGDMDLVKLRDDMFETMYNAKGVGLAAPQVGLAVRAFVVDGEQLNQNLEDPEDFDESLVGFKKIFINAQIVEESGDEYEIEEGCLSIPDVRADVARPERVVIEYFDENWTKKTETYEGFAARIIQHEYDHIDGILFTDHLSNLKRQLIKKELGNISKGMVNVKYKMRFPK